MPDQVKKLSLRYLVPNASEIATKITVRSAAAATPEISAQSLAIWSRGPRGHGGTDIARHVRQTERSRSASHDRRKTIGGPASAVCLHQSDHQGPWCISAAGLLRCISARRGIKSQAAQQASLALAPHQILILRQHPRRVTQQTMSGAP